MMDTKAKDAAVAAHNSAQNYLIGVARACASERKSPFVEALLEKLAGAVEAEKDAYGAMQGEREKLIANYDAQSSALERR